MCDLINDVNIKLYDDSDDFWRKNEQENKQLSEKLKKETPMPLPKYKIGETVYYYDYALLTEGKIRDIAYYWCDDREYIDDGEHHYFKVIGGYWEINYKVTRKVTPYEEKYIYKTRKDAEIDNAKRELTDSLKSMKNSLYELGKLGLDTSELAAQMNNILKISETKLLN